jgi:hypothetical protein
MNTDFGIERGIPITNITYIPTTLNTAYNKTKRLLYSVARVRERTIPTKRPSLVGEVIANFCG